MSDKTLRDVKIGDRLLVRTQGCLGSSIIHEACVEEISPEGLVKLRWADSGNPQWVYATDYVLLEILPTKEVKP